MYQGGCEVECTLCVFQDPAWYPSLSSRQAASEETQEIDLGEGDGEEEGEGGSQRVSRQLSTEESSPEVICPPPRKRRKRSVSSIQSRGEGSVQRGSGLNGSGSSSSSGNVSSLHTSSSSYPTSSSSSKDEPGGGGAGGGGGDTGGASGSFDDQTPSQEQEHEEGGHRRADGSNKEPQVSQDSNTQESQNSAESLSFSRLYPVDPSPGCEADRSTSITSSFPVSSGEGCVSTSTPKDGREALGTVDSTASPSVGYGGGGEEREGEKGEEGSKEGEPVEPGQEMEDTDATLGESELNVEEEEDHENGKGTESPPSSSSTAWQLVFSSNSNTCSTAKSSAATCQLSVHHALLSGSQFPDSLPDSELPPLVIDIQESQASQISTTTAVAQQAAKTCDKIEKVEVIEQGLEEKREHSTEEGGRETGEIGDNVQEEGRGGLIKEAWKRLYQDDSVRSEFPSSPMKSQLTASQVDSDSESFGLGEEVDGALEPSSAFSLRLTQSQTTSIEDKATPTIQQNKKTTPTIQPNEKTTPTIQQNEKTTPTIQQEPTEHSVQECQRGEVRHSTRDPISTPALTPDSDQRPTGQYHQREVALKDGSEGFSVQRDVGATARPVPTYESVTLEESAPFQSSSLPPSHSPQQTSPHPQQPLGPPSTCSQAHSMEVSQTSTSSAGETTDTMAKSL